ncbi:hypothetical protein JKY79_01655 [Candidatus Babeliales bacterium]|nr:hypothetical protein [Candidatus Babeliales bacterium]
MKRSILFLGLVSTCSLLLAGFTEGFEQESNIDNLSQKSFRVNSSPKFLPTSPSTLPPNSSMPYGNDESLYIVSKQHSNVSWGDNTGLSPKGNELSSSEISDFLNQRYGMFNILKSVSKSIQENKAEFINSESQIKNTTRTIFLNLNKSCSDNKIFEYKIIEEQKCIRELIEHQASDFTKGFEEGSKMIARFSVSMAHDYGYKEDSENDQEYVVRIFAEFLVKSVELGIFKSVPIFDENIFDVDVDEAVIRRRKRNCCIIL